MKSDELTVDMASFVGVWMLERFTERAGSSESNPVGIDPVGYLIYTADGFASGQLMRSKRVPLGDDPWNAGNSIQVANLSKDCIAYCGRYQVKCVRSEIIHMPIVALMPGLIEQELLRSFHFEDDTLTLATLHTHPTGGVSSPYSYGAAAPNKAFLLSICIGE